MMRRLLHLLLFCFPVILLAQPTIERSVVATAGAEGSAAGIHLSWTLGEPVVETFMTPGLVLTQGFQQGETISTPVFEVAGNTLQINAFPNPAVSILNLELQGEPLPLDVQLLDLNGRLLREFRWSGMNHQLAVDGLAPAVYVLQFVHEGEGVGALRFVVRGR